MISVETDVEDDSWLSLGAGLQSVVAAAVETALADQHSGDVVVLLTSNDAVHDLNRRFRGKDSATNVLSFSAAATARPHLGDIALAFGVCAAEAQEQGKMLEHHLQHLVVHGALHLVGYDHETDDEAVVMEDKERAIMAQLGAPDPYRDRAEPTSPEVETHHGDI